MVAITARCHTAHIYVGRSGLRCLKADAWQQFRERAKIGDVQLIELFGAKRLNADRNILQIFFTLLRSDNDFIVSRRSRFVRILGGGRRCEPKGRRSQKRCKGCLDEGGIRKFAHDDPFWIAYKIKRFRHNRAGLAINMSSKVTKSCSFA